MVQYDIFLGDKPVGTAYVEAMGLYTCFRCRCSFPEEGIYSIVADYGTVHSDLGICVPEGDVYVTTSKVASKYLGKNVPYFYALDRSHINAVFAPVELHESFGYISNLPDAHFYVQAGKKGLLIGQDQSTPADSASSE